MKFGPTRKLGLLGTVLATVVASLVLAAAPASATGADTQASGAKAGLNGLNTQAWALSARYRNFGNPGWCLDTDTHRVYIDPCNGGTYQLWFFTAGAEDLQLINYETRSGYFVCLAGEFGTWGQYVEMRLCDPNDVTQIWDAYAVNGHVVFESNIKPNNRRMCLYPNGVDVQLRDCVRTNVPNANAWDYYRTPSDPIEL